MLTRRKGHKLYTELKKKYTSTYTARAKSEENGLIPFGKEDGFGELQGMNSYNAL